MGMRRSPLALMSMLALSIAVTQGCARDTRSRGTDSGIRLNNDSGPPPRDAGPPSTIDSGRPPPPPPRDSGPPPPPPGSCRLDGFTQLPAACLPRCSSATSVTIGECPDSDCLFAALDADTTPPTSLALPDGTSTSLDCNVCFVHQLQTCWNELCNTSFLAWDECRNSGGSCTAENDALEACRGGSAVIDCENRRASACFPD